MLNILIDTGNAPPRTGIGIYGECLYNALRHQSYRIEAAKTNARWTSHSLRPLRRAMYLWDLYRMRNRRYDGADVVHFTNYYVPKRVDTAAYVASIHDLDPIMVPDGHSFRYRSYFKHVVGRAIDQAHIIETHTEAVRDQVLQHYDVDAGRIMIAGDGLSEAFTSIADLTPKTRPTLPILLYVGLINAKKNSAWLVRTVNEGVKSGALPRMKVVLAGRMGYGFEEVRDAILKSNGTAEWCSSPSMYELIQLYCTCTAVALPSIREGFGRTLLEAMYCGKPIVASRIQSSIEVAGAAANYFALDDRDEFFVAVRRALDDHESEQRRSVASQRLLRYSWGHLAEVYVDIYNRAAQLR